MKKKNIIIICLLVLAVLVGTTVYYFNSQSGVIYDNYPYEPDTPAPDPHDGTFVSEHGTMIFNGDGKSITIDFDETLSSLTGLPAGKHEGTYAFLSGDLPPHGSIDIRYDVAHEMSITIDGQEVVLDTGIAAGDGSSGTTGVNIVTSERIPLLFREDKYFDVVFNKQ